MSLPLAARAVAWTDPAEVFERGLAGREHAFWLDAGPGATSGWSWLGAGEPATSAPRTVSLTQPAHTGIPGSFCGGWIGWLGYDDAAGRAGVPVSVGAERDESAPQEAWLWVRRYVAFDHARRHAWVIAPEGELDAATAEFAQWIAAEAPPRHAAPDARVHARHTPAQYHALIEDCRAAIRAGDAYQLCLTTRFDVTPLSGAFDPASTYLRLRQHLPAHHGGIIRVGAYALLSASPEQFLHVADGVVRTRPIKGTRPRGTDATADAALAADLRASVKEQAENVMIVDLMRNDLQRVSLDGSVAAERLLEVESFSAVHQLVSTVAGRLVDGTDLGSLLDASFPAGSMTGAPKLSAMTILRGLEGGARGVYAGCFGWVGTDGRADLAMTIRSIVVHPGGAYVGAGGGITWLSDAADEVAEVGIKARGPLSALGVAVPPGW